MKNLSKKFCIALVAILMVTFGSVSAYAASNVSTVQAYTGVKIFYNGAQLTDASQPYIINSTTYVPLRMIMNNFGKEVSWDGANQKVIITNSATETSKDAQITNLQNQIIILKNQIAALEDEGGSISDIEDNLNDTFEDAGNDYFDDEGIETTIGLSGDDDDLYYTIKLDFGDADDNDNLKDLATADIKELMGDLEDEIESEAEDTDYEDADITGKLSDADTSYYAKFNGTTYTFSWSSSSSDGDLSDIEDEIIDCFDEVGYDYFDDDNIYVDISLDGDEDEIDYTIYIDVSDNYDDLNDVSESDIEDFLDDIESEINSSIDGTDFEDADITGILIDDNDSDYYVEYDGSSYDYSW